MRRVCRTIDPLDYVEVGFLVDEARERTLVGQREVIMKRIPAFVITLMAASAANAVTNFQYLHTAKGISPAVCYLVGFDTNVNEWYGVCEITEGRVEPNHDRRTKHSEVVYWSEDGVEKHSRMCTTDCPAQPSGEFDTYYLNGGSIPVYVVGTDPHNGVIGGNGVIPGTAMLITP